MARHCTLDRPSWMYVGMDQPSYESGLSKPVGCEPDDDELDKHARST